MISRPLIFGDLEDLKSLSAGLKSLDLTGTAVHGNLASLTGSSFLYLLKLPPTVYGDLASLVEQSRRLLYVTLRNSKIFGSFTALRSLRWLETLDLVGTHVGGELLDLPCQLRVLRADNVSGDLRALDHLAFLKEVTITGHLTGEVSHWVRARADVSITRTPDRLTAVSL